MIEGRGPFRTGREADPFSERVSVGPLMQAKHTNEPPRLNLLMQGSVSETNDTRFFLACRGVPGESRGPNTFLLDHLMAQPCGPAIPSENVLPA